MTLEMQTVDQLEVRFKHIPDKLPIQDAGGSFFCCFTPLLSSPLHKEGCKILPVRLMFCLNLRLSLLRVDLGGIRPWTLRYVATDFCFSEQSAVFPSHLFKLIPKALEKGS